MATVAQKIAERFGMDGQNWRDEDGVYLTAACEEAGGERSDYDGEDDLVRYDFPGGSAIVMSGAIWDLGIPGSSCFCGQGVGHHDRCSERDGAIEIEFSEAQIQEAREAGEAAVKEAVEGYSLQRDGDLALDGEFYPRDTVIHYMDDKIREALASWWDRSIDSEDGQLFLELYRVAHRRHFGEEFAVN